MQFSVPTVRATLLRRYKRFLADVQLEDGSVVTAHCANPGSMKTSLQPGGTVWLTPASNPHRKLKWTWEWAEVAGVRIFVNPTRANDVVAHAIKAGKVSELSGYSLLRREVSYGQRSRIDLLLEGPGRCYVEVKNVTLTQGQGRAAFPDSVTVRGLKHLRELEAVVAAGHRAVLFFCVAREDAVSVEPADEIDPAYGQGLRKAIDSGVEVLAYRCRIDQLGVTLQQALPLRLDTGAIVEGGCLP